MERDMGLPAEDEGKYYEQRALLASEHLGFDEDGNLDRFEAVKGDTRVFALSEYCAFFTIGLSMMWTW